MSNSYPPIDDGAGYNPQNFIDTSDDSLDITELELLFAKKYNMNISGTSTISGDINITDNKRIYVNDNPLHSFNKCRRYEYKIEKQEDNKSFLTIPFDFTNVSSNNVSQIFICSLCRSDGVFSIVNSNPFCSFYLLCSNVSVMAPIPIVQNQVESIVYDDINKLFRFNFDRLFDLNVIFSVTHLL